MLSATMIAPCASFGCSSSNTGTYRFFHRSISTKSNGRASCPAHGQQHLIAPPHAFLGRQRAPELLLALRPDFVLLEHHPHRLVHRSRIPHAHSLILTAHRRNTPATRRPPAASLRTDSRDARAS